MIQFDIPSKTAQNIYKNDVLKGIDLCNAPSNVAHGRSPNALNMINDGTGKLRKRMGYKPISYKGYERGYDFEERINGVFNFNDKRLVHAGTKLYDTDRGGNIRMISSEMNDEKSSFFPTSEGLLILDGNKFLKYTVSDDNGLVSLVSDDAYVPTLVISRSPSGNAADATILKNGNTVGGGGVMLEPLNLLCSLWMESFLGTAEDVEYILTEQNIDSVEGVMILRENGVYEEISSSDYEVDSKRGSVTFKVAPGVSYIEGMDNVIIKVKKEREGNADRINKCRFGVFYGADGKEERLFLSGNPKYPNMDFYSEYDNYTYFPDINYSVLSKEPCPVSGYGRVGKLLATHLDNDSGKGVIIRSGTIGESGKAEFKIEEQLSGMAAICNDTIKHFNGESLFLARDGVYAVSSSDLADERIVSLRSMYITNALKKLPFPEEACSAIYKGYYIIASDGKLFLLDGRQKQYSENIPKSAFQYECYICDGINAKVLWVENETLCFGDNEGKIWCFYTDESDPESYNDNGRAINAYWETPDIDGNIFFKNKTFKFLALKIAPGIFTGVKVFLQRKGIWQKEPILDSGAKARYFSFEYIDFEKLTFSSDKTAKTLTKKIKSKKNDKIRIRFQNDELNEPFGLYSYGLEFEIKNNFKG